MTRLLAACLATPKYFELWYHPFGKTVSSVILFLSHFQLTNVQYILMMVHISRLQQFQIQILSISKFEFDFVFLLNVIRKNY